MIVLCQFKVILLLGLVSLHYAACYKILALFHLPTGSHNILAVKLFKEIAKRGHEVTFVTPFPLTEPVENIKEIPLTSLSKIFQSKGPSMFQREGTTPFEKATFLMNLNYEFVKQVLSDEAIQNLLKSNTHFDAVIVYQYFNDAMLAIAHHFKAPVILFSSMPLFASESFLLKHPSPPSYVPNILTKFTGHMNFWERLTNAFYDVSMILYYQWFILPKHRQLVYDYIPGKPDLYDFLNNASLVLINSHATTNEPIPLVPNAVEIGGYHIEEAKPLPNHLQKFLDESVHGVILFTMGSISKISDFPKEKLDILIKTFSKLKQNVLFKWENDNPPDLPSNVKTMKWIPQADVLAHPNVKAFICHGGLLSTTESIYYAVPIVGIPLYCDQKLNMAFAKKHEYAVEVPYKEISEEKVSQALDQVLNDEKFKENVRRRSKILRDRPIKPLDNALYWIEYVVRHQGAPHLRYAGMDLNWCHRNLLDVIGFVIVTTGVTLWLSVYLLRRVFCKRRPAHKNKKE